MMYRKLTLLDSTFHLDEIVLKTPGFVGTDLSALIDEALNRCIELNYQQ